MTRKPTPGKPVPPLREQIARILSHRKEATQKQIVPLTTEAMYESRVTSELNKMRTEGIIECAKKPGKNELWYWLAVPLEQVTAGAVPKAEASQGEEATVLLKVISQIREAAGVGGAPALADLPAAIRKAIDEERSRAMRLDAACDGLRRQLQELAAKREDMQTLDETPAELLTAAQSQLDQVCELLAGDVDTGSIDPADMDAVEMAQAAQRTIRALRDMAKVTGAQPPRPEPRGYVVLGDGGVQANFDDFETARSIAEEMLDKASAESVAVCALHPMISGRIERRAVWSGQ